MAAHRTPVWFAVVIGMLLCMTPTAAAAQKAEPSFMHGFGQVLSGVFLELPRTTLEATRKGPPVVGTMVGLLAGMARALQKTVAGLGEMAAGFNPWS